MAPPSPGKTPESNSVITQRLDEIAATQDRIAAHLEHLVKVLESYRPALDRAAALGASPAGRIMTAFGGRRG